MIVCKFLFVACLAGAFVAVGSVIASGNDKQDLVVRHLKYLEHLERAESYLDAADADAALDQLEQALACEVPDSHVPQLRLTTSGAMAHYLKACAYTSKTDQAAAIKSLQDAAANGLRNTALVKSDPRLADLRSHKVYREVLSRFPHERPTDQFAGKTVANREFGMSLLMHRKGNFPKLGEMAPDFQLKSLGAQSNEVLQLSSFRGKQPVVLIFGSFT